VIDYSGDYPNRTGRVLARLSYEELKRGEVTLLGRTVESSSMSSYAMAREIAALLADEIRRGDFLLSRPLAALPVQQGFQGMKIREGRP
jgi:uncharacterized protein (DUF39 family)